MDPVHEATHRHLMRLLARSGQRGEALAQYARCCRLLADELDTEPAPETTALYEQIEAGAVTVTPVSTAPRHNLPAQLTPFIGREAELEHLHDLLATRRLVTLTGPGGIGKTRLVVEAAARQVANFAHGVFFVALAGLDSPDDIAPAIAQAVGLQFGSDQRAPRQQLLDYLRHREILLVLDNFEHLLAGADLVAALLQAAPQVRVLATSREKLSLAGEVILTVSGLEWPASEQAGDPLRHSAVRLFVETAWQVQHDAKAEANGLHLAARICRLLEGMPLGIMLAATWTGTLSLAEIAQELTRSLDFVAADLRDLPERHRSMRAVFESSWQRLSEAGREAFMQLAVFRSGFSRHAAQQVTGTSLRTLNTLSDKSLIRRGADGRYHIHELLRQFAYEKLSALPDRHHQAQGRHCAYYAHFLARQETRIRKGDLHEAVAELDNIRAMWNWAARTGNVRAIHQAANGLEWLHQRLGTEQEGFDMFTRAAEALRTLEASPQQQAALGLVLALQGFFAYRRGDPALGEALQAEGRAVLRALDARPELAIALAASGYCISTSDVAQAERFLLEAQELFRELGQEQDVYMCIGLHVAAVLLPRGQIDLAVERMQVYLRFQSNTGDKSGVHFALAFLAEAAMQRQDFDAARRYRQQAVLVAESAGLRRNLVESYWRLGLINLMAGDYPEAQAACRQALALSRDYGIDGLEESILTGLGLAAVAQDDRDTATECLRDVLSAPPERPSYLPNRATAVAGLAVLAGRAGNDPAQAVAWLAAARLHLAREHELLAVVDGYMAELDARLPAGAFAAAREQSQALDIDAIAAELLAATL